MCSLKLQIKGSPFSSYVLVLTLFVGTSLCFSQEKKGEIKAPDGVSYEVVSSSEITKAAGAECGFNKLAAPNPGIYLREVRNYKQYKDGKLIRTWQETKDKWVRCHHP
jgi:hypothetical protein